MSKNILAALKSTTQKMFGDNRLALELENSNNELSELNSLFRQFQQSTFSATKSYAQLMQDIVVLLHSNFKRDGYFVEFGATDGIELSNTYLLEKEYAWNGIVSEPAPSWHADLNKNRKCIIDHRCVWKSSNELISFREADIGSLSTIEEFRHCDKHHSRRDGNLIDVETVSLNDLLEQHHAPKTIDYLSIDTEGSEFDILSSFDFSQYTISIISCEHNYTGQREKIFELLSNKGYQRKYTGLSKFDDWYFLSNEDR